MEYQNVQVSVKFSHMLKGPGKLPGLCNRPILFVSSRGTPCMFWESVKKPPPTSYELLAYIYIYIMFWKYLDSRKVFV
jgi:hypothetical protein